MSIDVVDDVLVVVVVADVVVDVVVVGVVNATSVKRMRALKKVLKQLSTPNGDTKTEKRNLHVCTTAAVQAATRSDESLVASAPSAATSGS